MKIFLRILGGLVSLVVLVALGIYAWGEPIGPMGGRHLHGNVVTQPVEDWSFINGIPDGEKGRPGICQIEVDTNPARAVNIGCYGANSNLYVSHEVLPNHRISWAELLAADPSAP